MTPGGEDAKPSSSRPPALRKRRKLRKEEIVAEATRLFAERGYEGTSMGDLAERVGLRKASLFHHFESKDVLYATVLTQLIESIQGAIRGAATAEGSFADRLDALTDTITAMLGAHPHAARLLIREAMDWGPVMRDQLASTIKALLEASVAFAQAGQRAGVFNPALDAKQIIISLVGIYFIPFVIDRTVEGFAGKSPFEVPFIDERRRCVREQVRFLVLLPGKT
ncbi:MAG: Transcriptional regulator, TetR family [Labilithrix sp.]|nr:Transcriptional regulator, TetR family [Labilithrix sp.]